MAEENKARRAVELSFTTLLTAFFLVVAAMAGAYIWGVMAGRQMEAAPRAPLARQEADPIPEPPPPGKILQAHELEFTRALRGEQPRKPGAQPDKAATTEQAIQTAQEEAQPDKALKTESPMHAAQEQGQPEAARIAKAPEPADEDGGINDYVFQMAALKDEQAADALREKLEGRGLRTFLERSGKMLIVLARLRGNADRAAEARMIAQELRLGEPLLRSKKPAANQAARQAPQTRP